MNDFLEWNKIYFPQTHSQSSIKPFFRCIVFLNVRLPITKEVVPLQFRKNKTNLISFGSCQFQVRAHVWLILFRFLFHKRQMMMKSVCVEEKTSLLLHQKWSTPLIQNIQNWWYSNKVSTFVLHTLFL